MMICSLSGHLDYLTSQDRDYQAARARMNATVTARYLDRLRSIESVRSALVCGGYDIPRLHAAASQILADRFATVPEMQFPEPPSPADWIRLAADRDLLFDLYCTGFVKIAQLVHSVALPSTVICYGGLKPPASVGRKIADYRQGRPLDLWDLVRVRAVAFDIPTAKKLSLGVCEALGDHVVRCRVYYVRPRAQRDGPSLWVDPYRAIHFELKIDGRRVANFIELQILTVTRDAVGLIDHGIVHTRNVVYPRRKATNWLREFSYVGNILDARFGNGPPGDLPGGPAIKFT